MKGVYFIMNIAKDWEDYEIIDSSNGMKLERWKNIYLCRPDPQIIWKNGDLLGKYSNINAIYYRSNRGGGHWENLKDTPSSWQISYKGLTFNIKQMGFKHTGLFPEQAVNWDYIIEKIESSNRPIKVLNLFAYTGGASVACLKAGASVVHVDSSRGMIDWAKENVKASGLQNRPIRYLVDDVTKFVQREIRRGNKYDAIVMDPPSYGRGANGEIWDIEQDLDNLITLCVELLSESPLFFLINSYTGGLTKEVIHNLVKLRILPKYQAKVDIEEIGLSIKEQDLLLPCGITGRVEFYE